MSRLFPAFLLLSFASLLCFAQSPEMRMQFYAQERGEAVSPVPQARPVIPPPRFEPTCSFGLGLSSRYVREGWCENSSMVSVMQAEVSESGLYMGVTGTYNFSGTAGRRRHFQDDRFYMGYALGFTNTGVMGPVVVDLCWTYNGYPGESEENSGSLSMSFLLNEIWQSGRFALTGAFTLEHNYGKNTTFALTDATLVYSVTEDGSWQWANSLMFYWGDTRKLRRMTDGMVGGNAFYTAAWRSSLTWNVNGTWSVEPFVQTDMHPDSRSRDAARDDAFNSAVTFLGGIRLNCHF